MAVVNWTNLAIILSVFLITYFFIVKASFDKYMAALLGAVATMFVGGLFHIFDQVEFVTVELSSDYLILAILFGNLLMVVVGSEVGLFQFISIKLLKFTKGDPLRLYIILGFLTLLLSAVVNTIPAILVVGALTLVACNELEYDPKPYILMEIVVTNTGGLTTLISSITNLIIALPYKITFGKFLIIAAPLSLLLFVVSLVLMYYIAPIDKPKDKKTIELKISTFNEWSVVKDRRAFYYTTIAFVLTMIALLLSDIIKQNLAIISVGGGILMLYVSKAKVDKVFSKVDWPLLSFFASLFVMIKALELVHLLDLLTQFLIVILGNDNIIATIIMLLFSSLLSGFLDNVVLAVTLTPMLGQIVANSSLHLGPLIWALIIGTNLGGGLTPIGAPPGVLGLGILKKETGKLVGWGYFFKTVGVATIVRIFISGIYLILLVWLIPDPNFLAPAPK